MSNLKRVGINMVSSGMGYLIPMAINLLSTPYIINALGKEAFGLQAIANVVIGYLMVADMGLDIPIIRKIAEYSSATESLQKDRFLITTFKIYFLVGLIGSVALLLITNPLIRVLSIPENMYPEAREVFYLATVGFLASIVNMWGRAVFIGRQRYDIANGITIITTALGIIGGIGLIMAGYGVTGFFLARILGFFLSSLFYILFAKGLITKISLINVFDLEVWQYLKPQIGYGVALRLSGLIFSKMDQTLIGAWLGIGMVGVYSIPILIANTLSGLIASITHFAFPMATALNATDSRNRLASFYTRIANFTTYVSTLAFVPLLVLGDKFLALWISPIIALDGQYTLLLLLIAFYVNSCANIPLNAVIVAVGGLKNFTLYSTIRGLFLFAGFYFFIKRIGIEGAGLSYIIALLPDLLFFIYAITWKLKFDVVVIFKNAYLKPMTLGLFLGGIIIPFRPYIQSWFTLALTVALFLVSYATIAFKMDIFGQTEKQAAIQALNKARFMFNKRL